MTLKRCPVCGRHTVALAGQTGQEQPIPRKVRKQNPALKITADRCPRCLSLDGDGVAVAYFQNLLKSEAAVLPIPLRTDADARFTGRGVTIAFIDSGFFPHPDLGNRILHKVDVTDDKFGERYFRRARPESWHGTMSAVLACGSGRTGVYSGIASGAGVVCVKVLSTKTGRISGKNIARGIRWVIDQRERFNIRVVNVAVGGDKPEHLADSTVDQLVEEATECGLIVVVAGGNSPGNPILPPASAPSAITVGGYDDHNVLDISEWSLYPSTGGATLDGVDKPDILGPATQLPGPLLPGTDQEMDAEKLFAILWSSESRVRAVYEAARPYLMEKPGKGARPRAWARKRIAAAKYITPNHKKMEGTSVAVGIVSSVIAQILEAHPGLSPGEVRTILLESAFPMNGRSEPGPAPGILNAREAVRRALDLRHTPEVSPPGQFVSIRYENATARTVSLAGDFNKWNPKADPCHEIDDGVWSCFITRPMAGSRRYKLVVDGTEWVEDPSSASREPDGFGGWNSVFADHVDEAGEPSR